jgi:hypothetical protein
MAWQFCLIIFQIFHIFDLPIRILNSRNWPMFLAVHLAVNPPYQYTIWSKFIFIPLFPKYMTPGHQGFQRSHETRSPAVTLLKIFKLVLRTYCTQNRKSALDKHFSKPLKRMKRDWVFQQLLTRISIFLFVFCFVLKVLYSTLLHLPPLRFYGVRGYWNSNPGLLPLWHCQSVGTTRL